MLGPGMLANESAICELGCVCCSCGLKVPDKCCNSWDRCLCCWNAASFPFDAETSYLPEPVCAMYFISCIPQCGCCKPPLPEGKEFPIMLDGSTPSAAKGAPEPSSEMER